MTDRFDLHIRGARGSLPLCTSQPSVYGGNTSCIAVRHGSRVAVLDAGSGIVALGHDLVAEGVSDIDLILTHAHYDHVIGLPMFAPLYLSRTRITLWYAGCSAAPDGQSLLTQLMRPPFLPFCPADLKADLRFAVLPQAGSVDLGGTILTSAPVNHPGGAVGLRLARHGRSFAYVPDFEHDDGPQDATLVDLIRGCDLALLDCTYAPEEYPKYRGWGHSHWQRCNQLARQARVTRMGMFHHAHSSTDAEIAANEAAAQADRPGTFAAREGMILSPHPITTARDA